MRNQAVCVCGVTAMVCLLVLSVTSVVAADDVCFTCGDVQPWGGNGPPTYSPDDKGGCSDAGALGILGLFAGAAAMMGL
ncbi:MAG: hypothetical protein JXQ73_12705, partial [Phycisphaerae bacterium]|nr:hypothetical protein [Phycisphaerae bacterium]